MRSLIKTMSLTRTLAFGSLVALIGGAIPPAVTAAAAGTLPKLAEPAPARDGETPPPVPAEAEAGAVWYVVIDGAKIGPLTDEALVRRMQNGEVTSANLVWRAGMADWQTIAATHALMGKRVAAALRDQRKTTPLDGKYGLI